MRVTVEGEALARAAHNALIFIPARARNQLIRLTLSSDSIEFAGSDGYACGCDSAPVHDGPGQAVSVGLTRDGLTEIEATARVWKKQALTLSLDQAGVTLSGWGAGSEAQLPELVTAQVAPLMAEAWATLDLMFDRTQAEGGPPPEFVAWDFSLAARFAKVKATPDRVADCWFRGAEAPILVKIGPTFRGLLMPVYREPARAYSPEGLW